MAAASSSSRLSPAVWWLFAGLVIWCGLSLKLRYDLGLVHAFDTGIYLQILHNLAAHGDFASSVTQEQNFLAHHFQPVLALLAPLFAVWPSVYFVFLISWGAILWALLIAWRQCAADDGDKRLQGVFLASMMFYPCVFARAKFSFVPEILVLPLFLKVGILANQLAAGKTLGRRSWFGFFAALLLANLCKENIWLISGFVCLVTACWQSSGRWLLVLAAVLQWAIFVGLFFYWMPANTAMKSYYGYRYYIHDAAITGGLDLVRAMILNTFSWQSLRTLLLDVIFMPALLPFLAWRRTPAIWFAVPGLAFVVTSSAQQVHSNLNQYLLLVVPFLWAAALSNLQAFDFGKAPAMGRWLPLFVFGIPVVFSVLTGLGVYHDARFLWQPRYGKVNAAVADIRKNLAADAVIMVDGRLQSHFFDYRQVTTILGFFGNPTALTDAYYQTVTDVITENNLDGVACEQVTAGMSFSASHYDLPRFAKFCRWLQAATKTSRFYEGPHLYHLKIQ